MLSRSVSLHVYDLLITSGELCVRVCELLMNFQNETCIRCWCDVSLSPVFQVDWRIRLQADLQTLCHAVLCVLCGLLRERTGDFRLNPGKIWEIKCIYYHLWQCTVSVLVDFVIFTFNSYHFQVFVETLDKCFENVCELDLIFHVDKVGNTFESVFNVARF